MVDELRLENKGQAALGAFVDASGMTMDIGML